jgi:hypothetical protein
MVFAPLPDVVRKAFCCGTFGLVNVAILGLGYGRRFAGRASMSCVLAPVLLRCKTRLLLSLILLTGWRVWPAGSTDRRWRQQQQPHDHGPDPASADHKGAH